MTGWTFRTASRDDFPMLAAWLAAPHVVPWFGPPRDVERRYGPTVDGAVPTLLLVGCLDGEPAGLAKCYRHADHPEWDAAVGVPDAAGIDFLVAAPGRGHGTGMVAALADLAAARYPDCAVVVAVPRAANAASCRVLEKAGFALLREGPIDSPDPRDRAGPARVYVRAR